MAMQKDSTRKGSYGLIEMISIATGALAILGGAALTIAGAYIHQLGVWIGGLGTLALGLIIVGTSVMI